MFPSNYRGGSISISWQHLIWSTRGLVDLLLRIKWHAALTVMFFRWVFPRTASDIVFSHVTVYEDKMNACECHKYWCCTNCDWSPSVQNQPHFLMVYCCTSQHRVNTCFDIPVICVILLDFCINRYCSLYYNIMSKLLLSSLPVLYLSHLWLDKPKTISV